MKKLFIALAATCFSIVAQAQVKIGYTNVDVILSQMPETKTIETELKTRKDMYDAQYKQKVTDFQAKYQAYEKGAAAMSEIVRADKEKEIQAAEQSIGEFQKTAQEDLQKKQNTMLAPVLTKIQGAIDKVAKDNQYTHVFNIDAGQGTTPILLYATEQSNISELVLKQLGITPKPAAAVPAATPTK